MSYLIKCFFLFYLFTSALTPNVYSQTLSPAVNTEFQIPLSDKTLGLAVLLPITDTQTYLVYATPAGKIGFFLMTKQMSPIPPPPPPPPPPPIPEKLSITIVEHPASTTVQQRAILNDPAFRSELIKHETSKGIIPDDVKDIKTGKPPADLLPFLERAKGRNLPWTILSDEHGAILWEGQLPSSAQELVKLIKLYGG